jgi:hypothetical protein
MATPAFARPLEGTGPELGVQPQETPTVIPYLSHGILGEAVKSAVATEQPRVINYLSQGLTAADAVDPRSGIPLSAGIPVAGDPFVASVEPPAVPDAFERAVQASLQSAADTGSSYAIEPGRSWYLVSDAAPARPDDRGDRFVVGDGTPAAPVTDSDGFTVDWENGLVVGGGTLAIVLALALALAYMRRPKIAI